VEQSPSWEANSRSASLQIPPPLWNPKVHYRVSQVSILRHIQPVHNFPHYFPKIHSNVILLSMPRSSEWSLPFRFFEAQDVTTKLRYGGECYGGL